MEEASEVISRVEKELDDVKSKVRKLQTELDEKNEVILELREIIEQSTETNNRLRNENLELIQEARSAKALRDEIDILTERVRKMDRLETEVVKYKEKMSELQFMKSRVDEFREENRLLQESKSLIEDQLETLRKKAETVTDLERQVITLRALNQQLELQVDADREKTAELVDEVNRLRIEKKTSVEEVSQLQEELSHLRNQVKIFSSNSNGGGLNSTSGQPANSLLEQLNNDASRRILKLELQNQKLLSLVDGSLKGTSTSPTASSTSSTTSNGSTSMSPFQQNSQNNGNLYQYNGSNKRYSIDCSPIHGMTGDSLGDEDEIIDLPEKLLHDGSDSGCASLAGELNLRLERMERQNLQLLCNIEKLKDSEKKIQLFEDEKNRLETDSRELHLKLQNLEIDKVRFRQDADEWKSKVSRLEGQLNSLSSQIEQTKSESSRLEKENSVLQSKVKTLEMENRTLRSLIDEVKRTPLTDWTSSTMSSSISICRGGDTMNVINVNNQRIQPSQSTPTTPSSSNVPSSSPFIRGTCRSSSVNFGSLSSAAQRRTALALPVLRVPPVSGQSSRQQQTLPYSGQQYHHHAQHPSSLTQTIINVTTIGREPKLSHNGSTNNNGNNNINNNSNNSPLRHHALISCRSTPPTTPSSSSTLCTVSESSPLTTATTGSVINNNSNNHHYSVAKSLFNGHHSSSPSPKVQVTSIKRVTVESTISVQTQHHQSSPKVVQSSSSSVIQSPQPNNPRAISPTPSTVGTDSVWYEYGCV